MKKFIVSLLIGASLMTPVFAFADHTIAHTIEQLRAQIAQLQQQIAALQGQSGLHNGDRVRVDVSYLKIRGDAGIGALVLKRTSRGETGVLRCDSVSQVQCPVTRDNYTWWYIDWDSAALPNGWSAEGSSETDFLTKDESSSLPPRVCIQDVKQCIDGSYVSRISPSCEFTACPTAQKNLPPVIHGISGPTVLKIGETGTWTVKASDPENQPLNYSVVWGDETTAPMSLAPVSGSTEITQSATFTHAYNQTGTYNPTFTITDIQGATAKSSISVAVTGPGTGILYIEPQSIVLSVGKSVRVRAFLSPACPSGAYCIQSVKEVDAQWTSANPKIAAMTTYDVSDCNLPIADSCSPLKISHVNGIASGDTEITAVYTDNSGAVFTAASAKVSVAPVSAVRVLSPNGGEQWQQGTAQNIIWTPIGRVCSPGYECILADETVDILLEQYLPPCTSSICPKFAQAIPYLLAKQISDDGIFEWSVGKSFEGKEVPDGKYVIRVVKSGTNASDASDAPFSVVTTIQPISVLSPNGGESWQIRTEQSIKWSASSLITKVGIVLIDENLMHTYTIGFEEPNDGVFSWVVSSQDIYGTVIPSGKYVMHIVDPVTRVFDRSDTPFNIISSTNRLSINPTNAIIKVGATTEFQALFNNCPSGAQCFIGPLPVRATWTSSNSKIITVAYKDACPSGAYCIAQQLDYLTAVVTGVSLGTATITATYTDSSGAVFTASAIVTTVMP